MKKIGIMTFYDVQNYGAALQAYALQNKIKTFGVEAEFIRYYDSQNNNNDNRTNIGKYWSVLANYKFNPYLFCKAYPVASSVKTMFHSFKEEYMEISQQAYYCYETLHEANNMYDAFVCGSDMVWSDIGQDLNAFYLRFAPKKKSIAYAPSITGIDFSNKEQVDFIREAVNDIGYLSCREKYGVDSIKKITGREPFHAVDPTLLLTKEDWAQALNIANFNSKPYILCYMFQGVPKETKKQLKKLAKKKNMEVRYIPMAAAEYVSEMEQGYSAAYGPREFVQMVANASFVVTNSFHGLLFSLIFEKPFILLHRSNGNKWSVHEERMVSILNVAGVPERFICLGDAITESYFDLNYSDGIRQRLHQERMKSIMYLQNAIKDATQEERVVDERKYKRIDEMKADECTGCMSCMAICPKKCIDFVENEEGFLYPAIQDQQCVWCGKCVAQCPSLNPPKLDPPVATYVGFGKEDIVKKSASGGVFATIASQLLKRKAVVFGAALDETALKCQHIAINTLDELPKLQNSKYVQSQVGHAYEECKKYLTEGREVLFSGTPCQIAGLKAFLKKDYEKLYTIDIICHGVPSPLFFRKWLENVKRKYGYDIQEFSFRHKDYEGKRSVFETKIVYDAKVVYEANYKSPYYYSFVNENSYRESCYTCQYATEKRLGDITIGDCDSWRAYPDFYPEVAKSSILINSSKGLRLWSELRQYFTTCDMDYDKECWINHQLRRPSVRKPIRDRLYADIKTESWNGIVQKYTYRKGNIVKRILINLMKIAKKG